MSNTIRNTLAVIAGIVIGSAVNMGLITISGSIIPPPEGVDPTSMESLGASMHLFEPKHFIFPFLAHALGTLVGSMLAIATAKTRKQQMGFIVGGFFLLGGIANVFMLPSPMWFAAVDILGAYLPMAWIARKLILKN